MEKLKKYLMLLFILITLPMALVYSSIDSVFDLIAGSITVKGTMLIALVVYLLVNLGIYMIFTTVFVKLMSRKITIENVKYSRQKSLLFANIAHDLKTPLTTIIGFSKAIKDNEITDDKKKKEILDLIHSKAIKVNELLDLLFQYSKLDAKEQGIVLQEQDIGRIIREITAQYYMEFEKRGIQLDLEIPEAPVLLEVDKIEFSRAVTNLIINAYQHNKKGDMVLIHLIKSNKIKIIVADNGEIIPDEMKEEIFEPFVCGDESRNDKNGNGLGLAIAKKIIEMHKGKIYIDSSIEGYSKGFVILL